MKSAKASDTVGWTEERVRKAETMRGSFGGAVTCRVVFSVTVPASYELRLGSISILSPFSSITLSENTTLRTQNATSARLHTPTFPIPSPNASLTPCANAIANLELPLLAVHWCSIRVCASGLDRLHTEVSTTPSSPDTVWPHLTPILLCMWGPSGFAAWPWPLTGSCPPCGTNQGMSVPSFVSITRPELTYI